MKLAQLTSLFSEVLFAGYVPSSPLKPKAIKRLCKKTAQSCTTIDLKNSAIDNHKAMITAYWCKPGDCIIDVGVNQCNYAIFYQEVIGKNGCVIGYEANSYLFDYISKRMKQHTNFVIHKKAASDKSNQKLSMKVYVNPHNTQCGLSTLEPILMNEKRMPGQTEIIEVITERLDDLLNDPHIPKIRFIKIDVEGHEQSVLKGAMNILKVHRPLIIFEYGVISGSLEPKSIDICEECNYVCYDLKTNKQVSRGFFDILTDIVAVPKEFETEFVKSLPQLYYNYPIHYYLFKNIVPFTKTLFQRAIRKYFSKRAS